MLNNEDRDDIVLRNKIFGLKILTIFLPNSFKICFGCTKELGGKLDLWRDIPDSPRITRTFSGCYFFFFSINAAKSESLG